jgi:hypothetical protein
MEFTFDTVEELGFWALMAVVTASVGYSLWKGQRENEKINRAVEEQIRREAESKERLAAYRETRRRERKSLKTLILDEFKLIRRGDKRALGSEALEAVLALGEQEGNHPETLNEWRPVIECLKGEITDADAARRLLDDLLYPETLEDVEELQKCVRDGLERAGVTGQIDTSVDDAVQALREVSARDARKKREEWEAEARERCLEKEEDRKFAAVMDESVRGTLRVTALTFGLPSNAFEHLSIDEAWIQIRAIREMQKLSGAALEECARLYQLDQELKGHVWEEK